MSGKSRIMLRTARIDIDFFSFPVQFQGVKDVMILISITCQIVQQTEDYFLNTKMLWHIRIH